MKTIVNKENKELSFDFEGNTYVFPLKMFIQVEDGLYEYLKVTVPLAFNFEPEMKKTDVAIKVKSSPTQNKFTGAVFGKKTTKVGSSIDGLEMSGKYDKDGVNWYGEGIEDDQL